jgi:hypothetical protein
MKKTIFQISWTVSQGKLIYQVTGRHPEKISEFPLQNSWYFPIEILFCPHYG